MFPKFTSCLSMPLCMPVWIWRWSFLEGRKGGREGGRKGKAERRYTVSHQVSSPKRSHESSTRVLWKTYKSTYNKEDQGRPDSHLTPTKANFLLIRARERENTDRFPLLFPSPFPCE